MTPDDLAKLLARWAASVHGHLIDRDAAYGAQCWDLAADWAELLGCPLPDFWTRWAPDDPDHTLASSMWLYWPVKPGAALYFTRHGRHEAIQAGDIPIWARSYNHPSSHIAVALGPAGPLGIPCMTQNPGAAQRQHLATAGLLGFLRPITTTPFPEQDDDMTTIYARATSNSDPTKPGDLGTSRIWASPEKGKGVRELQGVEYSGVWAFEDGRGRRLRVAELVMIEGVYAATGRPMPIVEVRGNIIETMMLGKDPERPRQ